MEAYPAIAMFLTSDVTQPTIGFSARRVATAVIPLYRTCSAWRKLLNIPLEQLDGIDLDHQHAGLLIASYVVGERFPNVEAAAAAAWTMDKLYCTCSIWATILRPFMKGVKHDCRGVNPRAWTMNISEL